MSSSFFVNLRSKVCNPYTPWLLSGPLFKRVCDPSAKKTIHHECEVLFSDPEWDFVNSYFFQYAPLTYSIKRIFCVHNPLQTEQFETSLLIMDDEAQNPVFSPTWPEADPTGCRAKVMTRWRESAAAFSPVAVVRAGAHKEFLSHVFVFPYWHGTDQQKVQSICDTGFTYFGKHDYLKGIGDKGPSTDAGFFGSGIYFTNSARYAADMYSSGHLLLAWVSMRSPYPVIEEEEDSGRPLDREKLQGGPAFENYDAHYIPVIAVNTSDPMCKPYVPCRKEQIPMWDETVVFNQRQTLPRFYIELMVTLLTTPVSPVAMLTQLLEDLQQLSNKPEIAENPQLLSLFQQEKQLLFVVGNSSTLSSVDQKFFDLVRQLQTGAAKLDGWAVQQFLALTSSPHIQAQPNMQGQPAPPASGGDGQRSSPGYCALVQKTLDLVNESLKQFDAQKGVLTDKSVAIIGDTGAGKTTLIHVIGGIALRVGSNPDTGRVFLEAPAPLNDFVIGHRALSQSLIPRKIVRGDTMFWDCPGIFGNIEEVQEIAHAICIKKMFEISPQMKILLMINDGAIEDPKALGLIDLVCLLDELFLGNVQAVKSAISLVVSSSPRTRTVEQVQHIIKEVTTQLTDELTPSQIELFQSLITKPIVIINKPKAAAGQLIDIDAIRTRVMQSLDAFPFANDLKMSIALSPPAKAVASRAYYTLAMHIKDKVLQFTSAFKQSVHAFVQPFSIPGVPVPVANRQALEQKLQWIAERLMQLEDAQVDIAVIPGTIAFCRQIAKDCGHPLENTGLEDVLGKIQAIRHLEQFVTERTCIPLEIVQVIREGVAVCLNSIQRAQINIMSLTERERADKEAARAEAEKKRAQAERAKAEAAEQRAQEAARQRQLAEANAEGARSQGHDRHHHRHHHGHSHHRH